MGEVSCLQILLSKGSPKLGGAGAKARGGRVSCKRPCLGAVRAFHRPLPGSHQGLQPLGAFPVPGVSPFEMANSTEPTGKCLPLSGLGVVDPVSFKSHSDSKAVLRIMSIG